MSDIPIQVKEKLSLHRDFKLPSFSVFKSDSANTPLTIMFSNHPGYPTQKKIEIYQILPLIKVLAKRTELFSPKLIQKLDNEVKEIAQIISWSENKKEVILWDFSQDPNNENRELAEIIAKSKEKLLWLFDLK